MVKVTKKEENDFNQENQVLKMSWQSGNSKGTGTTRGGWGMVERWPLDLLKTVLNP